VHDETVKGINEGLSLEQIRARVELPPELGELSYLQPGYGRVEWGVNGVYRQYIGWYDFNPSHLNPGPSTQLHSAVVEACGGPAPLARRARRAVSEGDPQLALELTDIMLGAEPGDPEAHALRGEALQRLADTAVNRVDVNIYRAAARDHQAASAE
jgi:alkyl sulfatase BDS1-like metallo-beta-lactamase superfamily hydrolase